MRTNNPFCTLCAALALALISAGNSGAQTNAGAPQAIPGKLPSAPLGGSIQNGQPLGGTLNSTPLGGQLRPGPIGGTLTNGGVGGQMHPTPPPALRHSLITNTQLAVPTTIPGGSQGRLPSGGQLITAPVGGTFNAGIPIGGSHAPIITGSTTTVGASNGIITGGAAAPIQPAGGALTNSPGGQMTNAPGGSLH